MGGNLFIGVVYGVLVAFTTYCQVRQVTTSLYDEFCVSSLSMM